MLTSLRTSLWNAFQHRGEPTENGKDHPGNASSSLITLVDLPASRIPWLSQPHENYLTEQLPQALLVRSEFAIPPSDILSSGKKGGGKDWRLKILHLDKTNFLSVTPQAKIFMILNNVSFPKIDSLLK